MAPLNTDRAGDQQGPSGFACQYLHVLGFFFFLYLLMRLIFGVLKLKKIIIIKDKEWGRQGFFCSNKQKISWIGRLKNEVEDDRFGYRR